jgi:plasmid stabilization system protein ParE
MSVEVHFFSRAEKNIADAFSYYENESQGLGEAFLMVVEDAIKNISDFPAMYQKVYGDVRRARVHRFPYGVFYLYEQGEAIVLNVLNTKQDIDSLFHESH